MRYVVFNVAISAGYLTGIAVLIRELRTSTAEERRENQSVLLMIASTVLYAVVEVKTYRLVRLVGIV